MGCFLLCSVSVFEGRTSHPSFTTIEASFVYLLLLINISSFMMKKKRLHLNKVSLPPFERYYLSHNASLL